MEDCLNDLNTLINIKSFTGDLNSNNECVVIYLNDDKYKGSFLHGKKQPGLRRVRVEPGSDGYELSSSRRDQRSNFDFRVLIL